MPRARVPDNGSFSKRYPSRQARDSSNAHSSLQAHVPELPTMPSKSALFESLGLTFPESQAAINFPRLLNFQVALADRSIGTACIAPAQAKKEQVTEGDRPPDQVNCQRNLSNDQNCRGAQSAGEQRLMQRCKKVLIE